ncbi:chorismate mutase [Mesobacillus thioparans]|uniref:chorismate mutase n=1 Tax=Mesobacillus thioparans TaxID=370439 RepID=UPI0039F0467A
MIRGIRGAITVTSNEESEIILGAERLLKEMIASNEIAPDDVASIFISVTDDVDAAFPAKALRNLDGWTLVPIMCMKELAVTGSLPMCIRVMIHFNTEKKQDEIRHIYLEGAAGLRPDL